MKEISVVITRYHESDKLVRECLESLGKQKNETEVWMLDQQESEEIKKLCKELNRNGRRFNYELIPKKSLSFARNFGIKKSNTKLVAFCDVDCILPDNWLITIAETFEKTGAAIVGTKIVPKWESEASWYHQSAVIKEFYSLLDISETIIEIPKVVGASFAINKEKLGPEAYFDENLGRQKGNFLGGEETDLCQRAIEKGLKVVYTPKTFAYHQVAKERISLSWIQKRAYFGGLSRAKRGGKVQPFSKKFGYNDYLALMLILPFYMWGLIEGKMRR